MKEFNTSLLREKFVIHDPNAPDPEGKPVVALSNRIVLELRNKQDEIQEIFTVRAQNMHCCVRMSARILQSFLQGGPLLTRATPYDWANAWDTAINDYERAYNPQRWIAVYHKGKLLFGDGERHPLLDVIEKCNARNKGAYEDSIPMAEDAFKQTGKVVKIEYDGNVALVINLERSQGRCGIILRGANRTTTFNFSVASTDKEKPLSFPQILSTACAFLEGIQLAFMVGMNTEKIRIGLITRHSKEEKQTREARQRLGRLSAEISNLESSFEVRYRPERPEFQEVIMDAEKLAKKVLQPPEGGEYVD
jgi:hypothetical protein